jgi:hypothetical protein
MGVDAVGDGQSRDGDGNRRRDGEHLEHLIAADRDHVCPRTCDIDDLGDVQSGAGQRNGAAQTGLELHRAACLCRGNGIAERARSCVGEARDRARDAAALQALY